MRGNLRGAGQLVPVHHIRTAKPDPAGMDPAKRAWAKRTPRPRCSGSLPLGHAGGGRLVVCSRFSLSPSAEGVAGFAFSGFGRGRRRLVAAVSVHVLSDRGFVSLGGRFDLVEVVALDAAAVAEVPFAKGVSLALLSAGGVGWGHILGGCLFFARGFDRCVVRHAVRPPPCPSM